MSGAVREMLPSRRTAETVAFEFGGRAYEATVGFYPDGRPGEVFVDGAKVGSAVEAILDDAAVLMSLLLQHGVEPSALAKTIGRVEVLGDAASPIGVLVDLVCAYTGGPEAA